MTEDDRCDDHAHGAPNGPTPAPAAARALEQAAAMFRAAGDEGRLRLLVRLARGPACVTDLAEAEGEKVATISARLRLLHGARLVTRQRSARHVTYALADAHVARLIRDALDHVAEPETRHAPPDKDPAMTACALPHHAHHDHTHGPGCGHVAVKHDGHVCYLHDGHMHHPHGDHVDEHVLAVSTANPDACTPAHACGGHAPDHVHGPGCGHPAVPHGDHVCYLVDGHLHHPHGDHCDDHGRLETV
jgi:DNA-binding transcriptional ArsR family regulator